MNLFFVLIVACLSGVMILCALKLQRSFRMLEKRTELFLCMKETEGELTRYMKFMGRTNWALKNIEKVKLIALFVPGLQGVAADAEKAKKLLKYMQKAALVPYLKKLVALRSRGCPLDPRMVKTPFVLSGSGYARAWDDTAKLRSKKWTHHYVSLPYAISIDWNASGFESVRPVLNRRSSEKGARLLSILSSY